jgi:hypothetical protein
MRSVVNGLPAGPAGAAALNAVTYQSVAPGRPVRTVLANDAPVASPQLACSAVAAAAVLRLR